MLLEELGEERIVCLPEVAVGRRRGDPRRRGDLLGGAPARPVDVAGLGGDPERLALAVGEVVETVVRERLPGFDRAVRLPPRERWAGSERSELSILAGESPPDLRPSV